MSATVSSRRGRVASAATHLFLLGGVAAPAEQDAPAPGTRVTVVAGRHYAAGPLRKLLLGHTYRKAWTTPIEVEVLDLRAYAGGLTAKKKGGGKQTRSLTLEGRDGREYKFRSVDKDPSAALPPELRDTLADSIVQDQTSASHPAAALVADGLSDAAGILHANRQLYVMPDDPALGEFRREFAGLLGMLEQVPSPGDPGFESVVKILEADDLRELLDRDPAQRIDSRALLKARLFDVVIGDWDRHWEQWDWAQTAAHPRWLPIPKDRDYALAKFDGLLVAAGRLVEPRFVDFEEDYPGMVGLNWNARFLDRQVLTDLEWPVWEETAAELQRALTDSAIAEAVRKMPPPYYQVSGPRIETKLRSRRDLLPTAARAFYELLADEVAVQATSAAEVADVVRNGDGSVDVRLASAGAADQPYFRRRFLAGETDEVRIQLAGGDDRAVVRGPRSDIKLRVVGGDGNDVLDDSAGGGTELFDARGENRIVRGEGTTFSGKNYEHPKDRTGNLLRDWGRTVLVMPLLGGAPDIGLLVGAELVVTDYGFRKHPWAWRQKVGAAYATVAGGFRVEYEGTWNRTNSPGKHFDLEALASEVEVVRFHGFGNETVAPEQGTFYRAQQRLVQVLPAWTVPVGPFSLSAGPIAKFAANRPAAGSFLDQTRPYGFGDFGQVGGRARLALDRRDNPRAAQSGVHLWVEGRHYPAVWSVRSAFGEAHGEAAFYVPLSGAAVVAARAGGKRLWGTYPFHEAAFIGGAETVRGLRRQRYAGDAAVYGSGELRLALLRLKLLAPTTWGVFGLADAGRVYLRGESSDRWHTAVGGGIFVSLLKPENTVTLAAATSEGRTRIYFQGGFAF